jgi:hypothetical protein
MQSEWYCRIGNQEYGPYSPQELAQLGSEGRLMPTDFVRKGSVGDWVPAFKVNGLNFGPASGTTKTGAVPPGPPPPPPPPPPFPHNMHFSVGSRQTTYQKSSPIWPWVVGGVVGCGMLGFIVLIAVVVATNGNSGNDRSSAATSSPHARIHVAWEDGTAELQSIVSELTNEQVVALGLMALATQSDFYAARVRITNTGTLPVKVYPQNLRIHLDSDSTSVTTADDSRFLQPVLLQPGYYAEGLVMYQAHITAGASVRMGAGAMTYTDKTIEVTY